MDARNEIRSILKPFAIALLAGFLVSSASLANVSSVAGQEQVGEDSPRYGVDFDGVSFTDIPEGARDAITLAMNAWTGPDPVNLTFYLLDINWHETWATATLSSADLQSPLPDGSEMHLGLENLITLIIVKDEAEWRAAIDVDVNNVDALLRLIPLDQLDETARTVLFPAPEFIRRPPEILMQQAYNNYKYPWPSGSAWYMTGGWHDGAYYGYLANYGLDFDIGGGNGANSDVLASAPGTVNYMCNSGRQAMMVVTTDGTNERFGYLHLDSSTLRVAQGSHVNQGDPLGKMLVTDFGSISDNCGTSYRTHLHVYVPVKPFTMDGRTFSDSSLPSTSTALYSTQGTPSSSCDATGLPGGYVQCAIEGSGNYCNFSGTQNIYYGANNCYRVRSYTNSVECINDRFSPDPVPGTQKRCYKPPEAPSCSPNADQVALYSDPNYSGSCSVKGVGDYTNPGAMGIPNDSLSSIKVGANVKVTVCGNDNYDGTCETFTGDDSDLGNNSIGHDTASSAKVENRTVSPPTPTHSIQMYKDWHYLTGYCYGDAAGWYMNLDGCAGYDEAVSSIVFNSGWSARFYKNRDLGGTSRCLTGYDDDFANNTFEDGSGMNDQVSSFQLFNNTTCQDSSARDTGGVFRPSNGALYLKNSNSSGFADLFLTYGLPGDYPVVGDWDGNKTTTLGIYRNGTFYLRNSNTNGYADMAFAFGVSGFQPVAGDWNNDGIDTIGAYNSSTGTFYLRNNNSSGTADMTFTLGIPGDVGIAGDWNGDGVDSVGVFRPSNGALYLKNSNTTGFADIVATYGIPGDKPVTGDWNNDGIDTIGIYRNGTFYLRNTNSVGYADMTFALGITGDMPIAGNWDGVP